MFFAVWALFAAITCSHYARSSPVPPVVGALEPSSQDFAQGQDDAFASPDKRLLKYFLPESQALEMEEFAPMMSTQEDTKRGYSNKNYLRFGRGEEKRSDRNFLRFGRADAADKRNRNFLRFGRGPNRNFIRFGRSDGGLSASPLEYGFGLSEEELPAVVDQRDIDEMIDAFMAQKKRNQNSIRHGRSVDRQLASFCDNCDDSQKPQQTTTAQPEGPTHSAAAAATRPKRSASAAKDSVSLQRSKRFVVPNSYGYSMNHSPVAWAKVIPAEDLDLEDVSQVLTKRGYNVFSGPSEYVGSPSVPEGKMMVKQYPRIVRAPERNFLRFG